MLGIEPRFFPMLTACSTSELCAQLKSTLSLKDPLPTKEQWTLKLSPLSSHLTHELHTFPVYLEVVRMVL